MACPGTPSRPDFPYTPLPHFSPPLPAIPPFGDFMGFPGGWGIADPTVLRRALQGLNALAKDVWTLGGSTTLKSGKVQNNTAGIASGAGDFINLAATSLRPVAVKACESDGTNETGDAFDVYTPLDARGYWTYIFKDDIVQYVEDENGVKLIQGDKCLDEPIYALKKVFHDSAIRSGWTECDGDTVNGIVTPDMRNFSPMGWLPTTGTVKSYGDTAGAATHATTGTHAVSNHELLSEGEHNHGLAETDPIGSVEVAAGVGEIVWDASNAVTTTEGAHQHEDDESSPGWPIIHGTTFEHSAADSHHPVIGVKFIMRVS